MPVTRSISSGTGAAAQGDSSPAVAVREHRGQPQHELAHCSEDLHADLEQFEPQRRDLWACPGGPVRDEPQLLQQRVGRGGEQHEQPVGDEACATGAVKGDLEQFLDAVLGIAAPAVDALVDPLRFALEVGDHEASFEARPAAVEAYDHGLSDDATLAAPGAGGIGELGVDVFGLAGRLAQDGRDEQVELGLALQLLVLCHRDHVVDADAVEELEQLGLGEAAIETHDDAGPGEAFLQPADNAIEQRLRAGVRGRIAGPQCSGAQVLLALAIKSQERQQRQATPRVVEAVEERHLLGAVRGVVGDVEIDRVAPHLGPAATIAIEHGLEQCFAHRLEA